MNNQNTQDLVEQAKNMLPLPSQTGYGWLTASLIFAGVGFVSGVIFKLFGRFAVVFLLVSILSILALQYLGVVSLNFERLFGMANVDANLTIAQLFDLLWKWLQSHLIESISFIVGFVLAIEFI